MLGAAPPGPGLGQTWLCCPASAEPVPFLGAHIAFSQQAAAVYPLPASWQRESPPLGNACIYSKAGWRLKSVALKPRINGEELSLRHQVALEFGVDPASGGTARHVLPESLHFPVSQGRCTCRQVQLLPPACLPAQWHRRRRALMGQLCREGAMCDFSLPNGHWEPAHHAAQCGQKTGAQ